MNTAVLSGATLTLTAPMGGVVSGHAYQINDLIIVATADAVAGAPFTAACTGVYILAKATGQTWSEGEALYWDAGAEEFTTDSASGANPLVGVVAMAAGSSAVTGWVRLGPPTGGSGGGTSLLQMATVTLDNGQIQTLPSLPVEIVPAPGPGRVILPVFLSIRSNFVAAYLGVNEDDLVTLDFAYDPTDLDVGIVVVTGAAVKQWLEATGVNNAWLVGGRFDGGGNTFRPTFMGDDVENRSLGFYISNFDGNFSGGDPDNTLKITVYYVEEDA